MAQGAFVHIEPLNGEADEVFDLASVRAFLGGFGRFRFNDREARLLGGQVRRGLQRAAERPQVSAKSCNQDSDSASVGLVVLRRGRIPG